ncbi:MAG TPA: MBL fold metallo-hydrolase [Candidatus Saccharimonadales bacterium]|nr:MBL fold metallo-hydrolase [Candidatus Saccharimonadales bacterium]
MIRIGAATITPIFEISAGEVTQEGIPDATPEALKQIDWLRPHYIDEQGKQKTQVQSFLIEVGGKKIIVDGCTGDGRDRPDVPGLSNLHTGFMERLKEVCAPEEVDIVLCTHMHFDHVGWYTHRVNDQWIPTFPNAQHIFSEREFAYWNSRPEKEMMEDIMGFDESILPLYEAGLIKLVSDDYQVTKEVSLVSTPGHTPSHVSVYIESDGQSAVISGDVLHHPCQIARPDWGSSFDTDTPQANNSRKELLERFADTDTVFIGAHFVEPIAGKVIRDGEGFKLV